MRAFQDCKNLERFAEELPIFMRSAASTDA
jgi:hypothetical protein